VAKKGAKGGGTIRKKTVTRGGKEYTYWEARVTTGRDPGTGKQIQRSFTGKTQKEVREKMQAAAVEVNQGTYTAPQRMTVGQWLDTWLEDYAKLSIRPSSHKTYQGFIENHIKPAIGNIPLEKLTSLRLQKLYQDLRTSGRVIQNNAQCSGLSPKTVRSIHMVLHSALKQAVKEGLIKKNPTDGCNPPKLERKEMKVIQPEQIGAYLQAAANRNVLPMFYLELTSGLRRGELLALLWTDLDWEKKSISVCKSVRGSQGELKVSAPKTRHSIRTVVIPRQTVDLLIQEHELHPDNPYMFPSPVTGTMYHPDAAGRIHRKLLKEAGIEPVRFHDLRHPNIKPRTKNFYHFSKQTMCLINRSFRNCILSKVSANFQTQFLHLWPME